MQYSGENSIPKLPHTKTNRRPASYHEKIRLRSHKRRMSAIIEQRSQ